MLTPLERAELAVKALDSKKAKNIKMLKTQDVTVLADYFIICTAASTTQIKTLTDEVDKVLSENGEHPLCTEGYRDGGWVLIDYKTDREDDMDLLRERYISQLNLYARALDEVTHMPVRQKGLFLLRKGAFLDLTDAE